MVNKHKYQMILDNYLTHVEKIVGEFEREIEKQTEKLRHLGTNNTDEFRKNETLEKGSQESAESGVPPRYYHGQDRRGGLGIFNE
ncbi:hypothetical protein GSS87_07270 [Corynebacterium sp. 4HC-13]|uniref:hypothetical protein n=1 Tax=Corynebacterium anserum TaxID=2684406 RepID=UPI001639C1DE|nr:hypothetical protein [Corynebacterium anserum]MBC2682196.1 hypothetical protein [Corynebacterium anserum]